MTLRHSDWSRSDHMIKLSHQSELQDLHGTFQEEVLPPFPVEFEPKTTWAGAPAAIYRPREEKQSKNAAKTEEVELKA